MKRNIESDADTTTTASRIHEVLTKTLVELLSYGIMDMMYHSSYEGWMSNKCHAASLSRPAYFGLTLQNTPNRTPFHTPPASRPVRNEPPSRILYYHPSCTVNQYPTPHLTPQQLVLSMPIAHHPRIRTNRATRASIKQFAEKHPIPSQFPVLRSLILSSVDQLYRIDG